MLGCQFRDRRLAKRFEIVLKQISEASRESIPLACQDWANAKAAYRFFANERVTEADILSGHFRSTRERFAGAAGTMLVLHDTTQFSYRRENIGLLHKPMRGSGRFGQERPPLCGISMHSSLAVTEAGLPLGLAAVRFWTRKEFKGANALKRRINPTRVPIDEKESNCWVENLIETTAALGEPSRCVHIGDRAADIFELFSAANDVGTHFLVRTCVSRVAEDATARTDTVIERAAVKGLRRIDVRDRDGEVSEAVLEIKYERMLVLPPDAKARDYGPLELTAIHARERGNPRNRERIDWKLLTDLPVRSRQEAIEKLRWYALRWKIELFQDPEIRLQGGSVSATHSAAAGELDRHPLRARLADILDDDGQADQSRRGAHNGPHSARTGFAGRTRQTTKPPTDIKHPLRLPRSNRPTWRVPRADQRPASR